MDYYSILGIAKNATPQDIKKAYRKLAAQHHPDRGGNADKFKQVQEAYDILGDPAKRQQYDNPQPQYSFNSANFNQHPFDFEEIFAEAFGRHTHGFHRAPRKNRDITINADISLQDVYDGKILKSTFSLPSGRREEIEIKIPPGINDGQQIRYDSLGDDSIHGLPRGDLFVRVRIRRHPVWDKKGIDIHSSLQINVFDAILGCEVNINTPNNKQIILKVPKGTQNGTTFSINGYGIPNIKTGKQGSAFVKILTKIPKIEEQEIIDKIAEIKNAIDN